jgi:hypothetical protein
MRFHPFVSLPERMRTACDRSGANGKERDALRLNPQSGGLCGARLTSPQDLLTGYGYLPRQARQAHHGARYMDHELMTMWLSVDPMADKYPSTSPYAYCAWSPIIAKDPNGMGCARFYQNSYSIDDEIEAYTRQGLFGETWSSEEVREVYKTKYGLFWYGKNSQYSPTDKVIENNTLYQDNFGHPWIMYYGWEKDIVKERNK